MRLVPLALAIVGLVACNDVRTFEGAWIGPRVGDTQVLRVGVDPNATALLQIATIDTHGVSGTLSISGLVDAGAFSSMPGAEADALSQLSFSGSPLRVYLAFVTIGDGGGEALAVIALYDDRRVEVRVMRGGMQPLYAIFALTEG